MIHAHLWSCRRKYFLNQGKTEESMSNQVFKKKERASELAFYGGKLTITEREREQGIKAVNSQYDDSLFPRSSKEGGRRKKITTTRTKPDTTTTPPTTPKRKLTAEEFRARMRRQNK